MALIQGNTVLSTLLLSLRLAIGTVDLLITTLEKFPAWFSQLKQWLANLNPFDVIQGIDTLLINALNATSGINVVNLRQVVSQDLLTH